MDNYKWCNGYNTLTKYCTDSRFGYNGFVDNNTELDLEDDAAYVNWDKRGRIPSLVQIQELFDSCDSEWVEWNGVWGREFTSRLNGASLFFPAAGDRVDASLRDVGSDGSCWSRTLNADYPNDAGGLYFNSWDAGWWWGCNRVYGHSVRAVRGAQPAGVTTYTVNGVSFNMVSVKGGTFTMGATAEQGSDAYDWEKPTHEVTLSDFAIGQTEVTQELWVAVMGSNPSYFNGYGNENYGSYHSNSDYGTNLQRPVEWVSWEDCQTFISRLNELTGQTFLLPTEAEWEYAARGGQLSGGFKYSGSDDIGEVAWYNSGNTQPVATKAPNELGLYDMSGNVWEWCADWWRFYSSSSQTNPTGPTTGSYRVKRGGGYGGYARYCRVSYRTYLTPTYRDSYLGFRLGL